MQVPTLEEKQARIRELEEKIRNAQLIVFTDYRGLNVGEMTELRVKLKEVGAEYKVIKNTLARIAFRNNGMEELVSLTEGPNALVFARENVVEPTKVLFDFAKNNKNLEIKTGIMEGKVLNAEQLKNLSTLPPREVLVAQVLGGLQAPIYGLVYVLQANISGLARVLNAIREQKEAS